MKIMLIPLLLIIGTAGAFGQVEYGASEVHPSGLPNPEVPNVTDFAPMIGVCPCKSVQRNPDGTWQDTVVMNWKFKYILNGTAIQDETWRMDGSSYATSIRQYHADSAQWIVSYNSYPGVSFSPGVWKGKKQGEEIVLTQPQKAPNGMEGFSRLTFYDISENGWNWKGEWIKDDQSIIWPFWTIECER